MNNITKDENIIIRNVDYIKKIYINKLSEILECINNDCKIANEKKIESINGCKTILKDFEEDSNDINLILKFELEKISNFMKDTYIENSINHIIYKEIAKKIVRAIEDIDDIDLINTIKFTISAKEDIITEGIEELKDKHIQFL